MVDNDATPSDGISRRTVTKAMAWAIPAMTVAATVPIAAASEIVTVSEAGDACKLPGNSCAPQWSKGYLQPLDICNNDDSATITVTITTPATLLFNGTSTEFTPVPSQFVVGPNDCQRVILNLNLQDNSQNSSISGTLDWTWSASTGQSGSGQTTINTPATEPCVNCTV